MLRLLCNTRDLASPASRGNPFVQVAFRALFRQASWGPANGCFALHEPSDTVSYSPGPISCDGQAVSGALAHVMRSRVEAFGNCRQATARRDAMGSICAFRVRRHTPRDG
ncbi:hypothetical protein [Noviherbaspirillum saxi]|uniref:hypothetical protein n=1 Tax=Noviherbaspirillum saxi TaxID=2320863 RepID=UPI0011C4594F|nr:hypothetical protein [Noviherbaspirillum saxi]